MQRQLAKSLTRKVPHETFSRRSEDDKITSPAI
jgi:hypothetical protein